MRVGTIKKEKLTQTSCLYTGKAKSIYSTPDPDRVIMAFRDDISAFNAEKVAVLTGKGVINNRINAFIMHWITDNVGVRTHFEYLLSDTESVVKSLTMLPIEAVVRNYAAGGLCRRLGIELGKPLDPPVFEFFYKSDALGDPMINDSHIKTMGWASEEHVQQIKALTLKVNAGLTELFAKGGLRLVDYKLEYGLFKGELYLGDEITPDGCRLWDSETAEIFDKDRFRQDKGDVVKYYKLVAERLGI